MIREQTIDLLAMVTSLDHRRDFGPPDVAAWHAVLDDVPWPLARQAVIAHYRLSPHPIMPADVRRLAATAAGLLCPPEADAWIAALNVAQAGGVGRASLPGVVRDAYDALGGAGGPLATGSSTARAQFRDTYQQIAQARDVRVLSGATPALAALDQPVRRTITTTEEHT